MTASAGGGGSNNAAHQSSNEIVNQEAQSMNTSSNSDRGHKDKSIAAVVVDHEGDTSIAVTELEPEEPDGDDIDVVYENNQVVNKKKDDEKKTTTDKKKAKKQAKKAKKVKENQAKKNNQREDQLLKTKSNSNKANEDGRNQSKSKALVGDLKLFQNNHLLNQQDPMQQLQLQLNALIDNDDNEKRVQSNSQPFSTSSSQSNAIPRQHLNNIKSNDNENNCLSSNIIMQQQTQQYQQQQQQQLNSHKVAPISGQDNFDNGENIFTIKKGILWQQQNYDRFHQRLFSRWKKRYFILTTDYLVCFKRSSAKVGRSEMGKFLYKTSLNDVIKIDWLKPKKSDKGAIILHLNKQFNLFLWCKENLDEWMFMIKESVERNKLRRSCIVQNGIEHRINQQQHQSVKDNGHCIKSTTIDDGQLYENTALYTNDCATQVSGKTNNHQDDIASVAHSNNITDDDNDHQQQVRAKVSQGSLIDDKNNDNKQRSQRKPADERSSRSDGRSSITQAKGANNTSTGGSTDKRVTTKSIECEQNKEPKNENETQESEKDQKGSVMIHDLGDPSNSDAEINSNKNNINLTPKSSPVPAKRDLRGKRSSETSSSSTKSNHQQANNLSSKKQSKNKLDSQLLTEIENTKKKSTGTKETNLVNAATKSGSRDHQFKSTLAEGPQMTEEVEKSEEATLSINVGSNSIGSKLDDDDDNDDSDNNSCCDIESNNNSANNKIVGGSSAANRASIIGAPGNFNNKSKAKVQPAAQERPQTNLIRREDSWQSLVSLTRVGKLGPASTQVAQRSLYAQHIMPNSSSNNNNNDANDNRLNYRNGQGIINIESTVTPSRAPSSLQQSIQQPLPSIRKLRPFPSIGQQHAASFDVAPNSPMQHPNNYRQTSYQHKLLQLQLLHNSNNVDYIRHNGVGSCYNGSRDNNNNNNDYQIYGPESIATNHYGYSSMRSNLKSAASEFSFIRPSSMTQQHTASQSTLPHNNKNLHNSNNLVQLNNSSNQMAYNNQDQTNRPWLVLSRDDINRSSSKVQKSDSNNTNEIGCFQNQTVEQYLINPLTGERITNQNVLQLNDGQTKVQEAMISDLTPPMRELPMKPGKKRAINMGANNSNIVGTNNANMPKSSSLTSSIACFFRRAFSRRSKRRNSKRRAAKLAESCSSSLGTFEDNFSGVAIVPSAFSTGSKSIDIRKNDHQTNQIIERNKTPQSQRMIDMIEAFNNKTLVNNETTNNVPGIAHQQQQQPYTAPVVSSQHSQEPNSFLELNKLNSRSGHTSKQQSQLRPQRMHLNQFGSPLHKSNSISATMGLSHAQDTNDRQRNNAFLYDNELVAVNGGSPMLMRSTKVMSVNLTPLMSQRENQQQSETVVSTNQQQFFLSPRNNNNNNTRQDHHHQMPRPSSIYGQPSMISSPIITRGGGVGGMEQGINNFGMHRNSIHNPHLRDNISGQHSNNLSALEIRRQQVIKTPYLDTTREVAEDIPSPTTAEPVQINSYEPTTSNQQNSGQNLDQSAVQRRLSKQNRIIEHSSPLSVSGRQLMVDSKERSFDMIRASPSSGKIQQKAIVNPILQSPTMDTIYDNHPMMLNMSNASEMPSYSHYDNHNQLLMENNNLQHRRSPSLRLSSMTNSMTQFLPTSTPPLASSDQDNYVKHKIISDISANNIPLNHYNHQRLSSSELERATALNMMMAESKPSAIVAPSTPNHYHHQQQSLDLSSPIMDQFGENRRKLNQTAYSASSIQQQPPQSRSPMLSRRMGNHHTGHYQQSPLVSQQTRVLNKGDGVQATVIGDKGGYRYTQPVVNIAGAPGINLEPSLAASLLRGTNIDAYESSTFGRNLSDSSSTSKSNSKTFLVSTRLSKSMAQSGVSGGSGGQKGSSNIRENNGSPSSTFRDEISIGSTNNSNTGPKSSREELSSSGSRSITSSSIGRTSSRIKVLNRSRGSSQEEKEQDDQQEDSSSCDTRSSSGVVGEDNNKNHKSGKTNISNASKTSRTKVKEERISNNNNRKLQRQASDQSASSTRQHRKRRDSSSEPSDEIGSNAESLSDKPEERNWITSKLVE